MIALSNILTFNEKVPLTDAIKGLLFQNGENELLWFVAALYVYSIAFYWIERWSGNADKLLIVCLALFLLNTVYSIWLHGPSIPWHVHSIGFGCFYMGLGKWYRHHEDRINAIMNWKVILLCCVFHIAYIWKMNFHVSYAGSKYIIDALLITIIGIIIMIYGCRWLLDKNKFLLFVGANTLFYFAFHGKVYSLLQTITSKLLAITQYQLSFIESDIVGFIIVFLDATILIIPAIIINKYLPFILGRGFHLWHAE